MALWQKFSRKGTSRPSLESLGLHLPTVGMLAITGRNGTQNSSLLQLAANRFNDDTTRRVFFGRFQRKRVIYIDKNTQLEADTLGRATRKSGIRLTHQRIEALFNDLGLEQLLQPFRSAKVETEGSELHWTKRPTDSISAEQRQRVAIAIALLTPDAALFLDQPFDNLATATREKVVDALIKKSQQKLIVVASGDFGTIHKCDIPGVFVRQDKVVETWSKPKDIRGNTSEFLFALLRVSGYSGIMRKQAKLFEMSPRVNAVPNEEFGRLAQAGWFQVPKDRHIIDPPDLVNLSDKEVALGAVVILTTPEFCRAMRFDPDIVPTEEDLRKYVGNDLGALFWHLHHNAGCKTTPDFVSSLKTYTYNAFFRQAFNTLCPTLLQVLSKQNGWDHVTFDDLSSSSPGRRVGSSANVTTGTPSNFTPDF